MTAWYVLGEALGWFILAILFMVVLSLSIGFVRYVIDKKDNKVVKSQYPNKKTILFLAEVYTDTEISKELPLFCTSEDHEQLFLQGVEWAYDCLQDFREDR